ncbi:MAG: MFS transporter [Sedimenticolaceae bacterium]
MPALAHRGSMAAYALPAVSLAFLGLPLYVYLPAHYAALPGVGLAAVGVVLLVARLLDLLTDPLVGLLTDRSRRLFAPQWLMLAGAVLLAAGAWWLFRPQPGVGAGYLFLTLTVTYLGWTLLAIPYYALGAELGERAGQTRVAAWREAGMICGTLLAMLLPVLVGGVDALHSSALALLWLLPAAMLAVYWLGHAPAGRSRPGSLSLLGMWRDTGRPARHVLAIHLLNALAGGTAATLFVIYTRDALGLDERSSGLLLLLYFLVGLALLPLWARLARRIGEVRAWRAAMLLAAAGFVPAALLGPGDAFAFALVCAVTGATLGADIALPAALQARLVVAESRRLARPRGGALFGLWGMASKLALAIAAGVALPLLGGLSEGIGWTRGEVVPWLYAGLPVLIKLLAVLALQRSVLMTIDLSTRPGSEEKTDETDSTDRDAVAAAAGRRV